MLEKFFHRAGYLASYQLSGIKVIRLFLIIFAIKAIVAFIVFPSIGSLLGSNYHTEMFPDEYDKIAENLTIGNGYRVFPDTSPTMLRSPGFVILLAGIFYIFGKSLFAVQVIQYFMSACTAILIYRITQRLVNLPVVSLMASIIYLFHPIVIISDSRGGIDTTLMLCMTTTIWLLYRALANKRAWDYAILGLVAGYTMLVKASVALIFPAIFLYLIFSSKKSSYYLLIRNFWIVGFVATLVMMPWIIRNYELSGEFVPTMTVGGLAIFQGVEVVKHDDNGEDHLQLLEDASQEQIRIGRSMGLKMREEFFPQFYDIHDEVTFYHELGHRAWAEYKANPFLLVQAIIHNSWAFWLQGRTINATIMNIIIMIPFLLSSTLGAVMIVRNQPCGWILIISIIAFMVPHLVIIALARHCSDNYSVNGDTVSGMLIAPIYQSGSFDTSFALLKTGCLSPDVLPAACCELST